MSSNADFGMTMQKCICDSYNLPLSHNALHQFSSCFNPEYSSICRSLVNDIFKELNDIPVECLSYTSSPSEKEHYAPHNFILKSGQTLSIRTNKKGDKVAPRVVGQSGIKTFNEHFSFITEYDVKDKSEIKEVVYNNIHLMLPEFIDYLLTSDYTVWIQYDSITTPTYQIFKKTEYPIFDLQRENFSFSKSLNDWNESITLKYKGTSIAEIQIHKNRTFKFRFIISALRPFFVDQSLTTETFGITAEVAICHLYKLVVPKQYKGRSNSNLEKEMLPTIKEAFKFLPTPIESTGATEGTRGGNTKCSYDFLLEENKKLSLKTNTGKMVCPPEVGQPSSSTCSEHFGKFVNNETINPIVFKQMVYKNIENLMPIYIAHLFDSDFLLWIKKGTSGYTFKIFEGNCAKNLVWERKYFSFSKPSIDEWNESNTVKYKDISIGEFQVHKNRDCYKFRFNFENLIVILNQQ